MQIRIPRVSPKILIRNLPRLRLPLPVSSPPCNNPPSPYLQLTKSRTSTLTLSEVFRFLGVHMPFPSLLSSSAINLLLTISSNGWGICEVAEGNVPKGGALAPAHILLLYSLSRKAKVEEARLPKKPAEGRINVSLF